MPRLARSRVARDRRTRGPNAGGSIRFVENDPEKHDEVPERRVDAIGPVAGIIIGLVLWRLLPAGIAFPLRLGAVVLVIAAATWVSLQLSARRR